MDIRVVHLFEFPEHRAAVAGWIYDEFWSGQGRHSPASLEVRLKEAQDVGAIPLSLLALCGQTPVGP
ncbi:MAG TPA: hypothetical protein VFB96_17490 [Pirellulaceae bacterium]|nr:hypothetical protein [Pirellulaceae bacterium]